MKPISKWDRSIISVMAFALVVVGVPLPFLWTLILGLISAWGWFNITGKWRKEE